MASFHKRRNGDGSTSWDATVSVVGYPRTSRSFRSKLPAELWAARTEDARRGRTPSSRRGMTLEHLLEEALPRLTNPTAAVFAYWRAELGDVQLAKITPELIALHRDRLLGASCRGHRHKKWKPRSPATVRNYLIELGRLFALAVKELRVMDSNPCANVTKPKASAQVVRWLSDEERVALLAACQPVAVAAPVFAMRLITAVPRERRPKSIVLVCPECCTVVGSLQPALDTFSITCALGLGDAAHGGFQHLTLKFPLVHDVLCVFRAVTGFSVPRDQAAPIAQEHAMVG